MSAKQASLTRVALGLQFVLIGIAVMALLVIAILGLPRVNPASAAFLLSHLPKIALAVVVISMAGKILCLWVPENTEAKILIGITIAFEIPGFLINILLLTSPLTVFQLPVWMIANWPQLTAFASVFFILFLRSLAVYLNRDDLAKKAVILLITSFIIQGFSYAMLNGMIPVNAIEMLLIIGVVLIAVAVGLLMVYIRLLSCLRKEILDQASSDSNTIEN